MSTGLPSYDEAASLVAQRAAELLTRAPGIERIALSEAAGRILGQAIRADRDMPSFPRSTRDGFACRAAEASSHAPLAVAGSIRAGDPPAGPLPPGAAWEIMTGAAVPPGADAVAMLEHVETIEGRIRLTDGRTLEPGENVVPVGAEARGGDEVVPRGTRLAPAHVAAAAFCGFPTLGVFAKTRVAILSTGDELVAVDQTPAPGQIRNSNAPMLAALVSQAGGEPWILPAVRDDNEDIECALRTALQADRVQADLVLITGGVSAGKFDLVEPALARLGAKVHFTGVRIQPGKPLVYCEIPRSGDAPAAQVFGLPGNPISSAVTFMLFAVPILAALSGSTEARPQFGLARLTRQVAGKPGLTRFVPSVCSFHPLSGQPLEVAPGNWQGSGDLAAFSRANCLMAIPEGVEQLTTGELVRILPF
jgi:molybdopterin molybdotransferase